MTFTVSTHHLMCCTGSHVRFATMGGGFIWRETDFIFSLCSNLCTSNSTMASHTICAVLGQKMWSRYGNTPAVATLRFLLFWWLAFGFIAGLEEGGGGSGGAEGGLVVVQNMQQRYWCWGRQSQFREELWRPPRWLLRLLLCNCTDSGMWLGRLRRIFDYLKGGSNQPQSPTSSTRPFESQCFISGHKLLDRVSLWPKVIRRERERETQAKRGEAGPRVYIWNA